MTLTKAMFSLPPRQEKVTDYKQANTNELSEMFCQKLNPSRKEAGYPPYSVPRMNRMLQHLDLWDRKAFYASCLEAREFGSYFHFALRVV